MGEEATAYPFQDDNKKGNGKCNGSVAGGGFTSHPSQSARWMGHPVWLGLFEKGTRARADPFGDDNSGMTTRGLGLLLRQGSGWMVVLKRNGSSNSVRSPGFLPGMGWRRAERGLFHLTASEATSEKMRFIWSRVTSPGRGRVSRPVPQTEE